MTEEATIRRGVRNARYTTVPNHVFEDGRLSMEARWLLGYLLSKPDGWIVRLGDIRKKGGCGRDKARAMVGELVETGYAEREESRKDGKFNGLSLVIYDEPRTPQPAPSDESVASLPQPEKPATVLPATANPPLVKTEVLATPESSIERERGREDREEEDPKAVERWLKRHHPKWPSFVSDSGATALKAALSLTTQERDDAADRMADYLAAEKENGGRCAFGVYLGEKRWQRLPAKSAEPPKPAYAPAFGPVWAGIRTRDLVTGPKADRPLKAWEERAIADGALDRARLEKDNRRRGGWPAVNAMHHAAETRGLGLHGHGEAEEALGRLCEFVPKGSAVWVRWQEHHDAMGWPWLPDPGTMDGAYFPAGGPEGLQAFEEALRSSGEKKQAEEGNHDDAGRCEAAE